VDRRKYRALHCGVTGVGCTLAWGVSEAEYYKHLCQIISQSNGRTPLHLELKGCDFMM